MKYRNRILIIFLTSHHFKKLSLFHRDYCGNIFLSSNFYSCYINFPSTSFLLHLARHDQWGRAFDDKKGKKETLTHTNRIFTNIFPCRRMRLTAIYSFGLPTVCRAKGNTVHAKLLTFWHLATRKIIFFFRWNSITDNICTHRHGFMRFRVWCCEMHRPR